MSPSYQKRLKRRSEQRMKGADKTESMCSTFYSKECMLDYNELLEVSYIDDPQPFNSVGEGRAYYHDYEATATASIQIVEQCDYAICNTQPMQRIYDNLFEDMYDEEMCIAMALERLAMLKEITTSDEWLQLLPRQKKLRNMLEILDTPDSLASVASQLAS